MADDPRFDAQLPRWWERTATLLRGLALGFLLGYLFALRVPPAAEERTGPALVVAACLIAALLPSLPKAWIEQRNRYRAWRDTTLMPEVE